MVASGSVMAFAGAGRATAESSSSPSSSGQDITCILLGDEFAGTDHVFRLNGHVEAFSGVRADLFRHLARGTRAEDDKAVRAQVSAWRSTLHERSKALRRVNVKKTGN